MGFIPDFDSYWQLIKNMKNQNMLTYLRSIRVIY